MIEPPLEVRVDIGFAQLMALLANVNRDSKRHPTAFTPADFLPHWARDEKDDGKKEEGMAPEEILAAFDRMIVEQEKTGMIVRRDR